MKKLLTPFSLLSVFFLLLNTALAGKPLHIERWQTQAGTPVLFYQAMDIPMLNISLAFRAGSAYDKQQFGLSTLTTRLMNQGSDGLSADTLANQLAETGAQFSSENNQDMVILHLKTRTQNPECQTATALFSRIIKHPDFPKAAFQREKNNQKQLIQQHLETPNEVASQHFFYRLYQKHPYAHPVDGELSTLATITRADVKRFHDTLFVNKNAILVLVGALSLEDAKQLSENISHALPEGPRAPDVPQAKPHHQQATTHVPFPSTQTVVRLGLLGINHHNPNYFPLVVGNYTLGGGALVSQLATELREKRGLTYGVQSQFIPMPARGPFVIGFATQNTQAKLAEDLTRDTLAHFVKTGPSDVELQAAKQFLIGSFPLAIASNKDMASILLKMAFYHLPDDYLATYTDKIAAVTKQDILSAFEAAVDPKQLIQVMVGKV